METGVIMATQNFKRNLLLILYREGKKKNLTLGICFLLPFKEREKMSDPCSLFPPFGDPWPSCLLPSQYVEILTPTTAEYDYIWR